MPEQTHVAPASMSGISLANDQFKVAEDLVTILKFIGVSIGVSQYNSEKASITFEWEPYSFRAKDFDTNEYLYDDRNRVYDTFEISFTKGAKFDLTKQSWLKALHLKDIANDVEWNEKGGLFLATQFKPTGRMATVNGQQRPVRYRAVLELSSEEEALLARQEADERIRGKQEGGSDAAVAATESGMTDTQAVLQLLEGGPRSKQDLKATVVNDAKWKSISGLMVGVATGRLLDRMVEEGTIILEDGEYSIA